MSSFCLCSDMITAEYLYSYAALSLCTIIVRNRESCKITVRFAMHRILADCTNSRGMSRACLKKAFRELRVPVCGRFCPNEGGLRPLRQPNGGKLYRKVGLAACGNAFSDTLQDQIRFYATGNFNEISCHAKNQPQKPFRKTVADALPSTFSESHR